MTQSYSKRTTIFQRGEGQAGTPPASAGTLTETTRAVERSPIDGRKLSVLGE